MNDDDGDDDKEEDDDDDDDDDDDESWFSAALCDNIITRGQNNSAKGYIACYPLQLRIQSSAMPLKVTPLKSAFSYKEMGISI